MRRLTAAQIVKTLKLEPLADEGGLYRQTYSSRLKIRKEQLPARFTGDRSISTQIYYLLTDADDSFSAIHRLPGDEVYHFYLGDPVTMLLLFPGGRSEEVVLGSDLLKGEHVQFVAPGGVWQGSRLKQGGQYALLGTSMSPGFDVSDFELGNRKKLMDRYPQRARLIESLTRE